MRRLRLPGRVLPLLTPMSEVAGKLSVQEGAKYLEAPMGGRWRPDGWCSRNTSRRSRGDRRWCRRNGRRACVAAGMGAQVTIMDIDLDRLRYLDDVMPANVTTLMSNPYTIERWLRSADLVVGAVLVVGAKAPKLVTRKMLKGMRPGSVIVDVAIDQGGCCETSAPTTHSDPIYDVEGCHSLLRDEHAGLSGPHVDVRSDQCDTPLRA